MTPKTRIALMFGAVMLLGSGCSSGKEAGGTPKSGGTTGAGGTPDSGGATGAGGTPGSGGATGTGGTPGSGGMTGAGGTIGSGGLNGSGGTVATGGATSSGGTIGTGTGGAPRTGGQSGTGGRVGTGGQSGAIGAGGASSGGSAGRTGAGGGAGMAASGGSSGAGGGLLPKNPPVPSAGCGKATTVTSGTKTITSSGESRTYIIDVPTDYDMNKPYRLFYTSHFLNGTADLVKRQNYYSLKTLATAANEPAIFVAPQGLNNTWTEKDHPLFDDILAFVKANLCIDTTRVFATGMSFGGMITYSLSVNHQKDIRAAVGLAPANYNIYVPPKNHEPIAWMHTTGMSDTTCPWVNGTSTTQGSKYIAIEHATDNGCIVPATIPTWQSGKHLCYDFEGCKPGYPVKACTFDGAHTDQNTDPGATSSWIAPESWAFFTQF
jgi:poly(3-hydroxybutyrate) depolymerase